MSDFVDDFMEEYEDDRNQLECEGWTDIKEVIFNTSELAKNDDFYTLSEPPF